jgi:hypothetical protein
MLQRVTAEIIHCQERARSAREKADVASTDKARGDHLAAEARWLALARSYQLQQRLSQVLGENADTAETGSAVRITRARGRAFDPEDATIISSAFRAVLADLGITDGDEGVALRAAQRIIDLVAAGERDPERLKVATLAWVAK